MHEALMTLEDWKIDALLVASYTPLQHYPTVITNLHPKYQNKQSPLNRSQRSHLVLIFSCEPAGHGVCAAFGNTHKKSPKSPKRKKRRESEGRARHSRGLVARDQLIVSPTRAQRTTMDIASLLSPCMDAPLQPQPRAPVRHAAACSVESVVTPPALSPTSLDQHHLIAVLDQQVVAFQGSTNTPLKATTMLVNTARKKTKATKNDTKKKSAVKRKRRRRLTPKQLQVVLENRSDESQLYNLTLDVNDLKQQVRDFLAHKSIYETRALVARQRFEAGVLRTTQHYFNLLITGFREWEPQEAAFFAATFDPNVAVKSLASSVDFLFAKWKMYKTMVQMRYYGISSIRILVSDAESCVIECEGEFERTLTLTAIKMLFPHILKDQQLLQRVVNCRLVCPTRTMIYFDTGGRIVEYNAQADLFAALSRILASTPRDMITLMSNAHLGSNSSVSSDENGSD